MKTKIKKSNYRIYEKDGIYSIIEVFYDSKNKIIGYSDYKYPIANSIVKLKLCLSEMLKSTRNFVLTDEDLNHL